MSGPAGDAPPVLVLGGGLTALGVIRGFGRAGIRAYVATEPGEFVRDSRWYLPAPLAGGPPPGDGPLPPLLERCSLEGAVLMPCSDSWAMEVARLDAAWGARFPSCTAPPAALEALQDKARFADALVAAGVPHPTTAVVRGAADLEALPDGAFAGSFLKARDSQRFFRKLGVKAYRVRDRADALDRWRAIAAEGLEVVFQEYIPGPATEHYFVDGFVDGGGALAAVFCRRRLRMYPPDFGNSSYMVSVPVEEVADAVESVRFLLAHAGYRGIFNAELKHDGRDGLFKLLEVNARPWWYVEFAARCGVDVCLMAYREALGLPAARVEEYREGRGCVFPAYDVDACRELRRRGELALGAWARSWLTAEQPVFRWSDPMPAVRGVARRAAWRLARLVGARGGRTGGGRGGG